MYPPTLIFAAAAALVVISCSVNALVVRNSLLLRPVAGTRSLSKYGELKTFSLCASKSPKDPKDIKKKKEEITEEPKQGIEPKYLGAGAVFLFACLYDFFVTHEGFKDGWVP